MKPNKFVGIPIDGKTRRKTKEMMMVNGKGKSLQWLSLGEDVEGLKGRLGPP